MQNYFSKEETVCPCGCGLNNVDIDFKYVMNTIRQGYGKPITVNRWCSDVKYDLSLGGKGNHPLGNAADIHCNHSWDRAILVQLALKAGIKRIGIGSTFLHFDTNQNAPEPRIWLYR